MNKGIDFGAIIDNGRYLCLRSWRKCAPMDSPGPLSTISHAVFLESLSEMMWQGTILQWLHSFLLDRFQKAVLGDYCTSPWPYWLPRNLSVIHINRETTPIRVSAESKSYRCSPPSLHSSQSHHPQRSPLHNPGNSKPHTVGLVQVAKQVHPLRSMDFWKLPSQHSITCVW